MTFAYRRRYQGALKAVVLDWAGTVVDFGCLAPAGAFIEAFRRHGVDITLAQARGPMGTPKRDHIKAVAAMGPVNAAWIARHGAAPTEADIDAIYATFMPLQVAVVENYAGLIPGALEAVAGLRARGLKIGSTTGYPRPVMEVVSAAATRQGYTPDVCVCAGDTPSGRPGPSMALKCLIDLDVHPVEACVKIGDTVVDVEEGLNAGMWTVALVDCGNEVGLPFDEWSGLSPAAQARLRAPAADKLARAGAHYVIGSLAEVFPVLDDIERRLATGEKP
jgi:phosphonoacetaldehyde hydrolase